MVQLVAYGGMPMIRQNRMGCVGVSVTIATLFFLPVSQSHLFQPPRAGQMADSDRQSQHPA